MESNSSTRLAAKPRIPKPDQSGIQIDMMKMNIETKRAICAHLFEFSLRRWFEDDGLLFKPKA
jgi:hypothetical protein